MKIVLRKNVKNSSFIRDNYASSWNFIKSSRNYILFVFFLFLLFITIGVIYPVFLEEQIKAYLLNLFESIETYGFLQLFLFILKNNASSALFGMILGIIFGIFPIMAVAMNGYVLGFVAGKSVEIAGLPILLRLIPHGIFEIPAVFISLGIGARLGLSIFTKAGRKSFNENLKNSIRTFVFIILPLLVIAALIESALIVLMR